MKLTAQLLKASALCVALFCVAPHVQAQTTDLQALVRTISGNATYSIKGQGVLPIKQGMRLPAGSVIHTGSGTVLDLFLGRGAGVLRMKENTTLGLDQLTSTDTGSEVLSDTQLTLMEGEMLASVTKLPAGSHYEVKTPDGILGVRGTRFRARVPGGISVLDGTVVFAKEGSAHIVNGPGEYIPNSGNAPRALTPDEIPPLNREFQGLDLPGATARRIPPVPPADSFLSPIRGG